MSSEDKVKYVFGWIYLFLGIGFMYFFFVYLNKGQQFLSNWKSLFGTEGMWELDILVFNFMLIAIGVSLIFVGIRRIRGS